MQNPETILNIHHKRGTEGLPLDRVYKHLFNTEFYLQAYGKICRNTGAMTKGSTEETADSMSLQKIQNIIDLLKQEKYRWTPVRRIEIPKKSGNRPLGLPTWSDKLLQEVLRMLLNSYYEPRFSKHSHGFRENRSCHSALLEISRTWKGTVWFIEGDIKGCFDNIDHSILLEIIKKDIHDGRLINLIKYLLKAGYLEDWKYYDTLSGTPQGGIISPLLTNIYLNELDKFVEGELIPAYTKGENRKANPNYTKIGHSIATARKQNDFAEVKRLKQERRKLPSGNPLDQDYRRLRYIRYADDFLLNFAGTKKEAEEIREKISEYLKNNLKLNLSEKKTLITHATDGKANFLGYEITVVRSGDLIASNGMRATNGHISLLMPSEVVNKYRSKYSKKGKITHRAELLVDSEYTIIQRYQAVLRGIYNYYCMATNVSKRVNAIKWILETSLTKTLAFKFKCKVPKIYNKFQVTIPDQGDGEHKALQVVINRQNKTSLIATFGGFTLKRRPKGIGVIDFRFETAWLSAGNKRSEVVQRLLVGKCELCGSEEDLNVHHIRKLADLAKNGRKPKAEWEKIMSARKRKTLVVCHKCHCDIHGGRYDGNPL